MAVLERCHYIQLIALLATALPMAISLSASPFMAASRKGFSVELIHRDSPASPYYNPDETPYERLHRTLRGSMARAAQMIVNPVSEITVASGLYLMNISIGTPPVPILALIDTGSELTWTQCKPCDSCFKQSAPLFDPSKSLSYQDIWCHSYVCALLNGMEKCNGEICEYLAEYVSGFFARGNLARDTVTMASTSGQPIRFDSTVFGCTHGSGTGRGPGVPEVVSSIVGLGDSPISLLSQMGDVVQEIFSYCLVPYLTGIGRSGTLNFGSNAVVSGAGTVATPMVYRNWYFLTLEGITVSGSRIELKRTSGLSDSLGNIIIDSGATLTYLRPDFYSELEQSVAAMMKLPRVHHPTLNLSLCYRTTESEFQTPSLTIHFKGADVKLSSVNTFVRVNREMVCFAFHPTMAGQRNTYGSLAQTNFLIGYDVRSEVLSFKPMDCTQI